MPLADLPPHLPLSAYREPPAPPPEPSPFEVAELVSTALRPHRALDLVLVDRARLGRTIARGRSQLILSAILLGVSALSALPYGVVLGPERAWRIAALFLGSVIICFPSLHVLGGYLGSRNRLPQTLCVALLVSAVAGIFSLSFAPIVWFIAATTRSGSVAVAEVSTALLGVSIVAGVFHLARTAEEAELVPSHAQRAVLLGWVALLLFVVQRMGAYLGLG